MSKDVVEDMAIETFAEGVRDLELQWYLQLSGARDIGAALASALEFESFRRNVQGEEWGPEVPRSKRCLAREGGQVFCGFIGESSRGDVPKDCDKLPRILMEDVV